jgi:signal peptidase II
MHDLETIETPPQAAPRQERLILFVIAIAVILLDQFSKNLVEQSLALYEVWAPFPALEPYFRFIHAANTGAAFGLFPDISLFFGLMALLVSGFIIYYNHTLPADNRWLRVALGLTLGGALGNLIDRLRLGHVTDFLDFGPWPVFNVADMAVVSGAILLGWLALQESRQERREVNSEQ